MMKVTKLLALAGACLAGQTTPAGALDAAARCEAAKLKVAAKYGLCRLKAEASALRGGTAPNLARCDAKFIDQWSSAETVAAGQCQTNGDEAALQGFISQHTDEVTSALAGGSLPECPGDLPSCQAELAMAEADLAACQAAAPGQRPRTGQTTCYDATGAVLACGMDTFTAGQDGELQRGLTRAYVDNGDGTISDITTGLMWERLSADGSIHDRNGGFDFEHAFATKAVLLNAAVFAGHGDWRVPNRSELESLVDLGRAGPAVDPVFDTGCVTGCTIMNCSCTGTLGYWSSTTDYDAPLSGWVVDFTHGDAARVLKTSGQGVRLVRGGS